MWIFFQFLHFGLGPGDLSIVFIPWGSWLHSLCIQWNSISSLSAFPKSVLGAAWIKSKICNCRSSIPLWPTLLKCLQTSFLPSFLWIDVKWLPNQSINRNLVWPTYCLPQFLHVMQYIKLLDLHVTHFLQLYSWPVVWLLMWPVLSNILQYRQFLVLQRLLLR